MYEVKVTQQFLDETRFTNPINGHYNGQKIELIKKLRETKVPQVQSLRDAKDFVEGKLITVHQNDLNKIKAIIQGNYLMITDLDTNSPVSTPYEFSFEKFIEASAWYSELNETDKDKIKMLAEGSRRLNLTW